MDLVVTTAYQPSIDMEITAREFATNLSVPMKVREHYSLAAIRKEYQVNNLLVVTKKGPVVYTSGGEYFFHLNMAKLRIKNILNGKHDHMVTAMDLREGMSVLDCTLGIATDAIVASFVTGAEGKVQGLEASPVIAAVTGLGLRKFTCEDSRITAALRRIEVKQADYNQYLRSLPSQCFDIVFFDPMFRCPVRGSSNMNPLRFLADNRPLKLDAVREACRVAKSRVVIKEINGSPEFARLGVSLLVGGNYSSIQYGVLEAGGSPWNV